MIKLKKLGMILGFVMLGLMVSVFDIPEECVAQITEGEKTRLEDIVHKIEIYSNELERRNLDDSILERFQLPSEVNLPLSIDEISFVCNLFQKEEVGGKPVLNRITIPSSGINVVGDLHGKLSPTIRQLHNAFGNGRSVLFLGDFMDRGAHSLEVATYLLAMRLLYPDRISINRGDHETLGTMQSFGTIAIRMGHNRYVRGEIQKYKLNYRNPENEQLVNSWFAAFNNLPWASVLEFLDGKPGIYCAHGGFGSSTIFTELGRLSLPINVEEEHVDEFNDIAWSDPSSDITTYQSSSRGAGVLYGPLQFDEFCDRNNVGMIIKGHQHEEDGKISLLSPKGRQCLTVMGTSKIKGYKLWAGSFCLVTPDGRVVITDYDSRVVKNELEFLASVPQSAARPQIPATVPVVHARREEVVTDIRLCFDWDQNEREIKNPKICYRHNDKNNEFTFNLNDSIQKVASNFKSITGVDLKYGSFKVLLNGHEVDLDEADLDDVSNMTGEKWSAIFDGNASKISGFLNDILIKYEYIFKLMVLVEGNVIPRSCILFEGMKLNQFIDSKFPNFFKGINKSNIRFCIGFLDEDKEQIPGLIIMPDDIISNKIAELSNMSIESGRKKSSDVYLSVSFADNSIPQDQVQIIDASINVGGGRDFSVLSDDGAGKTVGKDRFGFSLGGDETKTFYLNFDVGQRVSDARQRIVDLFNTRKVYGDGVNITCEDVTFLFTGKALQDHFWLNRLRVTDEKAITIYVKDKSEIILLTAKANRVPVPLRSVKGEISKVGGVRVSTAAKLASVAAPREILRQGKMRLVQGDITGLRDVGAIVNAANEQLAVGGGIDG
ncbi:MAG: metallophosphoesterase, partial [Streptococcaceae bacterium]|nr:metallophosphoesterase [Streptococcaceae bacterium]